ncbi:MAG TPA: ABC transporter permease [Steroidobacteraceae bacterium]|nr:ABC transporter permease [Steroidobacteraceae bacterium]
MSGYYLRLAWLSLKRTPAITLLMIGAIALGIGATTTTLTVYHRMSTNPIAHRNDVLRAVTIDNWSADRPFDEEHPDRPPTELTYRDAVAIAAGAPAARIVAMRKTSLTAEPGAGRPPFLVEARLATRDFFPMFDVPFAYGTGWDARADRDGEPVVVLSKETNGKLFGGENSVGRVLRLDGREYRVIGVLADWQPTPKFYDLNNGDYDTPEDLFLPFALGAALEMQPAGNVNCWKTETLAGIRDLFGSECIWHQLWAELRTPAEVERFQAWLDGYVAEQRKLGRFARKSNNRLYTVDEWLTRHEVVGRDSRVLLLVSFAFLAVCVLNVVGLLLSRFLGAAGASAIRRALGASRGEIFRQHLVEVGAVGALAGLGGLALGALGLRALQQLYGSYDRLTQLDLSMILAAIALAVLAGVLAGLYPAWRICRVQPAGYLKTQ